MAPAIFQSVMDCVLQGPPVTCYLNDILIAAPTEQEHNLILEKVINKLKESGIHLEEEKCKFAKCGVEYLGHIIDTMGMHPMEDKVLTIHEAPIPQNVTQSRAFVGLLITELLWQIYPSGCYPCGPTVQIIGERHLE